MMFSSIFCVVLYFAVVSNAACSVGSCCGTNQSRIVGLFKSLSYQDRAVQLAYNNRTSQVCYESFKPFSTNASEAWQDVCKLLSGGLVALIADQPLPTAVKDVIDAVQIPVVSTSPITTDTNSTIVSIAPSEEQLANASSALIVNNSWTDVVLLTWQGSGIELFLPDTPSSYKVAAVYYIDTSDAVVRSKLIKIRQGDVVVIILHHYDLDKVLHIFKMATEEGLNVYPYVWILLGNTVEMLISRISSGNVFLYIPHLLGVYPVMSSNQQLTVFTKMWKNHGAVTQRQSAAYLHDAFNILLDAMDNASLTIPNFTQIQQSCEMLQEWQHGRAFQTILKEKSNNTRLTAGNITYHYFSIDQYGFNKIANWANGRKISQVSSIHWCTQQELVQLDLCKGNNTSRCNKKILPPRAPPSSPYQFDYSRYNFDVVTINRSEPFVYVTTENRTGELEEVYKGLCIDLMDKLSEVLGFSYTVDLVEDGRFGGQDEDGNWMGLIGVLVNRKAEIALGPLTITSNRGSVIDFTKAYYDIGLQALYNLETGDDRFDSELFTFLKPFDTNLWLLVLASIIVVSVGVAVFGRLSPYDKRHDPPDDYALWESRFQITFYNVVWESLSAVLQQGAETAPRSASGRILMGGWWFVCLLLATSYTANLTAIFITEDNKSDIPDSIDGLTREIPPKIPFGALNNTQTTEYLEHSPIAQYREAFQYMKTEGLLYETLEEARLAVLHDNIALITDSPYIDFFVSRRDDEYNPDCTLISIGDGQFSAAGYGLGLTKNSPFTDDFSLAILELREKGEIENLINEYFSYRRTCVSETAIAASESDDMNTEKINLKRFGGVFVILGIAIVISPIALLAELAFKHRRNIKTVIVERLHKQQQEDTATLPDSLAELRTSTEL